MSVHCIIRSNKHQLMHQNIYNLYSWKSPTYFDSAGPSSGRIIFIHYGCIYIVKCECALGFTLRLRGVVYCPRSVRVNVPWVSPSVSEVSCTVRGLSVWMCPWFHPPFERCRVLSAVCPCECALGFTLRLRGAVYCPRSIRVNVPWVKPRAHSNLTI
jgi:hypothetical protein